MPLDLIPKLFNEEISIPSEDKKVEDPIILGEQSRVGWKFANYFNTDFVWPETYYDYLSSGVKGVEMNIGDKKYIIYYHDIVYNPSDKIKVPKHEIAHVYQKGADVLPSMYSLYIFSDGKHGIRVYVPTGRILIEGGAERLLEKINEEKTGAYPDWTNIATKIDYKVSIESLYSTAENKGNEAVWNKMYSSGAVQIIDNYVLNLVKKIDPEFKPVFTHKINVLFD